MADERSKCPPRTAAELLDASRYFRALAEQFAKSSERMLTLSEEWKRHSNIIDDIAEEATAAREDDEAS